MSVGQINSVIMVRMLDEEVLIPASYLAMFSLFRCMAEVVRKLMYELYLQSGPANECYWCQENDQTLS